MGGCVGKSSFTITKPRSARLKGIHPFMFCVADAEVALVEAEPGEYLLYTDSASDKVILSVRMPSIIRHCRINEVNKLFFLDGQPYAYLDSIIYYHQKHKLNGVRLKQQAHLSARVVRGFAHKVARSNGNVHTFSNGNGAAVVDTNDNEETNNTPAKNNAHRRNNIPSRNNAPLTTVTMLSEAENDKNTRDSNDTFTTQNSFTRTYTLPVNSRHTRNSTLERRSTRKIRKRNDMTEFDQSDFTNITAVNNYSKMHTLPDTSGTPNNSKKSNGTTMNNIQKSHEDGELRGRLDLQDSKIMSSSHTKTRSTVAGPNKKELPFGTYKEILSTGLVSDSVRIPPPNSYSVHESKKSNGWTVNNIHKSCEERELMDGLDLHDSVNKVTRSNPTKHKPRSSPTKPRSTVASPSKKELHLETFKEISSTGLVSHPPPPNLYSVMSQRL